MRRKQNNFGAKYGDEENITEKAEWLSNIGKELEGLKERPKAKIQPDSHRTTNINTEYKIGKRPATMAYIDTGLKKKITPIYDRLAIENS